MREAVTEAPKTVTRRLDTLSYAQSLSCAWCRHNATSATRGPLSPKLSRSPAAATRSALYSWQQLGRQSSGTHKATLERVNQMLQAQNFASSESTGVSLQYRNDIVQLQHETCAVRLTAVTSTHHT